MIDSDSFILPPSDGLIGLPADINRAAQLTDHVVEWVISRLGKDEEEHLREEVFARVRTELKT